MDTYFVARRALLVMCLLAMPALSGCQTVAGFGRDVQGTGRWISGGAEDTEAWMFGSEKQAAEAQNMSGSTGMAPQKTVTSVGRVPNAGGNVVYFATGSAHIPADGMDEIRNIATAFNSSGQSNTSMQGADNSSMQSSNGSSGQSAGNSSGQNTANNPAQSAPRFEVIGYSDTVGSAGYNRKLSQRRAQAVANALAAHGVPRDSIDVQWHGEDQLPVPTADGLAEPQNRRVSIAIKGG